MSCELTKLSETRWRLATARRVYYVRQMKAPNEDTGQPGTYGVDEDGDGLRLVIAESLEQVVGALGLGHPVASIGAPTL